MKFVNRIIVAILSRTFYNKNDRIFLNILDKRRERSYECIKKIARIDFNKFIINKYF